jgi:hypothetical protein
MADATGGSFDDPSGEMVPLQPIPDRFHAPVFPYRGTEQHGVHVDAQPWMPVDANAQSWQGEEPFDPEIEAIKPIPVEIVNQGSSEIRSWRAIHFNVGKTSPSLIIGQNTRMTKVTVRHAGLAASDNVIWIGHDSNVTPGLSGWPIFARETIEINTEEEIYAITGAGTDESTPLSAIIEVTVGE